MVANTCCFEVMRSMGSRGELFEWPSTEEVRVGVTRGINYVGDSNTQGTSAAQYQQGEPPSLSSRRGYLEGRTCNAPTDDNTSRIVRR